jgi:adenylate kinase family enzyme
MKFIFLVGLPGSGKTYMGKQMGGLFLDDICWTCGKDRLKELFTSQMVIVADPSLCRSENRFFAEKMVKEYHPGCEVEWIYFENNPEKCWNNIQHRKDGRKISKYSLNNMSKRYKIPEGASCVQVWQCE